jgi:hypothetical protein
MSLSSWLPDRLTGRPQTHGTQKRKPSLSHLPKLETLEGRVVLSTLTVTSNGDSIRAGSGSLRAEIAAAHAGDTIVFAPSLDGETIQLGSQLLITKSLKIQGPGAGLLAIRPRPVSGELAYPRILQVGSVQGSQVTVTVSGLTLEDGGGTAYGYYPITGGSGWDPPPPGDFTGGAILNYGTLTVSGCALVGNSTGGLGANIRVELGGAIYNAGTLTLTGSTLFGNSASHFANFVGRGGAVYNVGTAKISDCTLANNGANYGNGLGQGGGIFNGGTLTVSGCTVSGNSAAYGGGILNWGALNLINTIVAGNTATGYWTSPSNFSPGTGPDIDGAVATADHNLVGDATGSSGGVNGVNGNIVGGNANPVINALLGPLQNNGGTTETMALLAGSPAIGHADNSEALATDERGVTRLDQAGETTDIGAFEL